MKIVGKLKSKLGLTPAFKEEAIPDDLKTELDFIAIYEQCKPYTMTSPERMYSLFTSISYLVNNGISGDFVECGVWKGGSSMMIAKSLLFNGVSDRKLFLYDTFEGMSDPKSEDEDLYGNKAAALLDDANKNADRSIWCYSGIEEVKNNIAQIKYPAQNMQYIKGKVEDTIPGTVPGNIALLRLDTDWYESTYHELTHLYPLLAVGGILIIDDYGHWQGARKAVDTYFSERNITPLLHRIDYTGRILIKTQ